MIWTIMKQENFRDFKITEEVPVSKRKVEKEVACPTKLADMNAQS